MNKNTNNAVGKFKFKRPIISSTNITPSTTSYQSKLHDFVVKSNTKPVVSE